MPFSVWMRIKDTIEHINGYKKKEIKETFFIKIYL